MTDPAHKLADIKADLDQIVYGLAAHDPEGRTAALAYLLTAYDCIGAAIAALDADTAEDPRA